MSGYQEPEILEAAITIPKKSMFSRLRFTKSFSVELPDDMNPNLRKLLSEYWSENPDARPLFQHIRSDVEKIHFKVLPHINSAWVEAFVANVHKKIEAMKEASNRITLRGQESMAPSQPHQYLHWWDSRTSKRHFFLRLDRTDTSLQIQQFATLDRH
jgi:hypothetical protein